MQVTEQDLSEHVRERLEKEHQEKERLKKEKADAHLYTIIRVARDEDLKAQIGDTLYYDLVDHEKVTLSARSATHTCLPAYILCDSSSTCRPGPKQLQSKQQRHRGNRRYRHVDKFGDKS